MTRDDAIALKIVNKALQNVKSKLEPLTYAVNLLEPQMVPDDIEAFMTDSEKLYFNSQNVIRLYEKGKAYYMEYQIIHILMHGILGHFADTEYSAKKLAWRVMDLEVEQILDEIGLKNNTVIQRPGRYKTIGMSLYHQSLRNAGVRKYVLTTGAKRMVDEHELWWNHGKAAVVSGTGGNQQGQNGGGQGSGSSGEDMTADKWKKAREYLLGGDSDITSNTIRKISDKLKSKNKGYGSESSGDCINVKAKNDKYSFTKVFREFLQTKNVSKDQPDYLDHMLYQYGLDMYGDIPLIEPMEETEEMRLSNMIIAIDTSGSCEEYVSKFLGQIVSIFEEISTHFQFEKIYLMQCDSSIKNICEFSEVSELAEVNGNMRMYGFGGTSFTPVFRWIDKNLTSNGEQVDCLLYLSDGMGSFPSARPEYPAFFILPEEELANGDYIPEWVRKVTI